MVSDGEDAHVWAQAIGAREWPAYLTVLAARGRGFTSAWAYANGFGHVRQTASSFQFPVGVRQVAGVILETPQPPQPLFVPLFDMSAGVDAEVEVSLPSPLSPLHKHST